MRKFAVRLILTLCVLSSVACAEEFRSGLPVGAPVREFVVNELQDDGSLNTRRCPELLQDQKGPAVVLFVRAEKNPNVSTLENDKLRALIKDINRLAMKARHLQVLVVLLDDKDAAEQLKNLRDSDKIENVKLTGYASRWGPKEYNLSPEVDVTVSIWRGGRVSANFSFRLDRLDRRAIAAIMDEVREVL